MRVLYSFWGFITPLEKNSIVDTPDGERGNRVDFTEELLSRGHVPIQLQKMWDNRWFLLTCFYARIHVNLYYAYGI